MNKIQLAFKQAMTSIASELKLTPAQLNIWIRFDHNGMPRLIARNENKNLGLIHIDNLIRRKMIGLRLCNKKLTHFFRTIHVAYLKGSKIKNPTMVSLVLYTSKKVEEICVGIYLNETAKKAFRLTEVIELTDLGKPQLN